MDCPYKLRSAALLFGPSTSVSYTIGPPFLGVAAVKCPKLDTFTMRVLSLPSIEVFAEAMRVGRRSWVR